MTTNSATHQTTTDYTNSLDDILAGLPDADPSLDWSDAPDGMPLLAVITQKVTPGYGYDQKTGAPPPAWRWPCPSSIDIGPIKASFRVEPADVALAEVWTSDAHFVPYVVVGPDGRALAHQPRVNKTGLPDLRAAGFDVRVTCAVSDIDNDGHAVWTDALRAQSAPMLARLDGVALWYETRKGLRVVRPYSRWVTPEQHEGGVHTAFLDELRTIGFVPDAACSDWTRLYRLPFVMRDGQKQTPVRSSFGSSMPFDPPAVTPKPVVIPRVVVVPTGDRAKVIDRARKYVSKIDPPDCGGGKCDAALWKVCVHVRGFGLDEAAALDIVNEWADQSEHRRKGEWTEREILRRVRAALSQSTTDLGFHLKDDRDPKVERIEDPELVAEDLSKMLDAMTVAPANEVTPAKKTKGKKPATVAKGNGFVRTDLGNAERFVALNGADVRFLPKWGKWVHWDGRRYTEDSTCEIQRRAQDTVRSIYAEAKAETDPDLRKALAAHAIRSEGSSRIAAMIKESQARPGVAIDPSVFDADPWLLNVQNGVVDLRTGKLLPHDRARLISKLCAVAFDPSSNASRWEQFLREAQPSEAVRGFLQRLVGYALTGVVRDHVFPVFYGKGRNGKGTFINAILDVLAEYACDLPAETLMAKRGESHPTDRTILHGRRFASASETKEGSSLDVALVKRFTGGDPITARRMREDFWTFDPTHKLVLQTNHRPAISETKDAVWMRVVLVPWDEQFVGDKADTSLADKLKAEREGILAWAVRGCLEWQRVGLAAPDEIKAATNEYRNDEDLIGRFLTSCCTLGGACTVGATDLFNAWKNWAEENNENPSTQKRFGMSLKERAECFTQARAGSGRAVWRGLRLNEPAGIEVEEHSSGPDKDILGDI